MRLKRRLGRFGAGQRFPQKFFKKSNRPIQPGLHRGHVDAGSLGNLAHGQVFVEMHLQNLPVDGLQPPHGGVQQAGLFGQPEGVQRRNIGGGRVKRGHTVFVRMHHLVQRNGAALAEHVQRTVPRNREQPRVKIAAVVVQVAAFQHANPGLLKQVFGKLHAASQAAQIPHQAVLIPLNQLLQQVSVLAAKPLGNATAFGKNLGVGKGKFRNRHGEAALMYFDFSILRQSKYPGSVVFYKKVRQYGIEPFQPASQRIGLPQDMPRTPQKSTVEDCKPMEFLKALYGMFRQMSLAPGSKSLQKIKTTPQEGRALGWLNQHGPALMSELADFMDIPLSTATSVVNRLVEKKQVTRQRSEEDRRIVRVHLTPAGQRLSQRMLEVHLEASKLLLEKLSRDEQESLIALITKAGYNPPAKDVC